MNKLYLSVIPVSAILCTACTGNVEKSANGTSGKKFNVLFIAIDDLRPQLGCYGFEHVKSPNIDKIAANGLTFTRAYCQQALCAPSRTSLLTGLNPDVTGIIKIGPHFRDSVPNVVTLPQYFMQNGYFTQGFGKIYHGGLNDPQSWSVPVDEGNRPRYAPVGQAMIKKKQAELIQKGADEETIRRAGNRGPAFESYDCPDGYFRDGGHTEGALAALENIKDSTFFLAVGFNNPHIPYVSPKRYWDMYSSDEISLPYNQYPPEGAPVWAIENLETLYWFQNVPDPLTDEYKKELIRGYLAATSYIDAQIGLLVDALRKYKLLDNTIIIIWGDHGYQLGEHTMWTTKSTNYETSTLAPLIISVPGMKAAGQKTTSLTEFIDIYPSLADICGLGIPSNCQGKSFKPLLDNPGLTIKDDAFSQYPKGGYKGYSIRNDRYRLVQWTKNAEKVFELYDHQTDPDENKNIVGNASTKDIVEDLSIKLDKRIENDAKMKTIMRNK